MNARRSTGGVVFERRPSFTLVEMLVVVTIIGILMSIVYGGMDAVRLNAQINRTRAVIVKLHLLIMGKYDSFRTRRVAISPPNLFEDYPLRVAREAARVKLASIRELMRMELPQFYVDLNSGGSTKPTMFQWPIAGGGTYGVAQSAVFDSYIQYRDTLKQQGKDPSPRYGSAEMLYMIVTVGLPNGRQSFSEDEIGDVDDDGWPEFIDAWGNPIYFLRWAPGFTDSAIQLNNLDPRSVPDNPAYDARAPEKQHDPFDPMIIEPNAYQLIPLIYSAGPDGIYDIQQDEESYTYFKDSTHSPYGSGVNDNMKIGAPRDSDNFSRTGNSPANGRLDHYDNIHNHRLGTR